MCELSSAPSRLSASRRKSAAFIAASLPFRPPGYAKIHDAEATVRRNQNRAGQDGRPANHKLPERKDLFADYPDLGEADLQQALSLAAAHLDDQIEVLDYAS